MIANSFSSGIFLGAAIVTAKHTVTAKETEAFMCHEARRGQVKVSKETTQWQTQGFEPLAFGSKVQCVNTKYVQYTQFVEVNLSQFV